MGAYTFYSDDEIEQHLNEMGDVDLKELIAETNKGTNRVYFAKEYKYSQKRVLRKPLKKSLYSLYVKTSVGEAKCINFAPLSDFKTTSMNYTVDKAFIMTYLFGVLTGMRYCKKLSVAC